MPIKKTGGNDRGRPFWHFHVPLPRVRIGVTVARETRIILEEIQRVEMGSPPLGNIVDYALDHLAKCKYHDDDDFKYQVARRKQELKKEYDAGRKVIEFKPKE